MQIARAKIKQIRNNLPVIGVLGAMACIVALESLSPPVERSSPTAEKPQLQRLVSFF